jgi:probable phosphomutase (TIGR03848 family)
LSRVLLIRHARCDETGRRLHGRAPGVRLNGDGERDARDLAARLAGEQLAAVYTSPVERARQTAGPIAGRHQLVPVQVDAFTEIDFGGWTGRTLEDLQSDEEWAAFNSLRSVTRAPAGELMLETQQRAVSALLNLRQRHQHQVFAIVSHADVLRAIIAYVLGMPLDHLLRLEIAPASVSVVHFHGRWPQLLHLNCFDLPRDS